MNSMLKKLIVVSGVGLGVGLGAVVIADQQIADDLVIKGSLCTGVDCSAGETFGFDTIRMKENNLRIHFIDTSSASSFPTFDWQITINDSLNGGNNYFRIEDITSETHPFTILGGARNDSIYVSTLNRVGFNTSNPLMQLHVVDGNSPTLRLHQDGTSGFTEQVWDIGGNESSFFIRDFTNGNNIPFRIQPSAPNGSLFIANDGDVGLETLTPDGMLDIAHPSDPNNHALIVSPLGYLGVNVDNSFLPRGLLDVQTTAGVSRFLVQTDGIVGVNTGASGVPTGLFDIQNGSGASLFNVTSAGAVTATGDVCTNSTSPATCLSTVSSVPTSLKVGTWTIKEYTSADGTNGTGGTAALGFFADAKTEPEFTISKSGGTLSNYGVCGKSSQGSATSGCLTIFSSRALKDIEATVDTDVVLEKLSSLEMTRWRYKADESGSIVHMGVMAEDFHKAFGLNGNTTDKIAMVDAVGVSMASIQALNNQLKEKDREIAKIHSELSSLKQELKEIKALVQLN